MKDASVIPEGMYCYSLRPHPDGTPGKLQCFNTCPYLTSKAFNGVDVPWCDFLETGSIFNGMTKNQFQQLVKYFGSEEAVYQSLRADLLWDGCKECGINEGDCREEETEKISTEDGEEDFDTKLRRQVQEQLDVLKKFQ